MKDLAMKYRVVLLALLTLGLLIGTPLFAKGDTNHHDLALIFWNKGEQQKALDAILKEIESNPENLSAQYDLAQLYEDMGEPFKAYFQWKKYFELDPKGAWSERAKWHTEELKASKKVYFEGVRLAEVKLNSIFPSIYKFYTLNPIGYALIVNNSENAVRDVKVSFSVKKYMDFPTESSLVEEMAPGESLKVDLHAGFNNQILEITEDTPIISSIGVSYSDGEKRLEKSKTDTLAFYNRNAMTWSDLRKISSFVTSKDPAVRIFARGAIQSYKDEEADYIPPAIYKAMLIFNSLGSYGMTYIEDPVTPYREISENADSIDFVQYPIDTLRLKTGDCDDGVVLFASMLESIGIPVALVDFPGHVYPMFNTGIPLEKASLVSHNKGLYVPYKGTVWLPLETTVWGKTFTEAWHLAADRFYRTPADQKQIIEIGESWKEYNAVTLLETGWSPEVPAKDIVDQLVTKDVETQHGDRISYIQKRYEKLVGAEEDDFEAHNKLGIVYGKNILYDEAIGQFEKALGSKPDYIKARVNLGYAYFKKKMLPEAIEEFEEVLKLRPDSARLQYNVGMIYYRERNYEKAREKLEIAARLDPAYKEKFESIPLKQTEGRASEGDVALPELEIVWAE